jgi:hypothetical protein
MTSKENDISRYCLALEDVRFNNKVYGRWNSARAGYLSVTKSVKAGSVWEMIEMVETGGDEDSPFILRCKHMMPAWKSIEVEGTTQVMKFKCPQPAHIRSYRLFYTGSWVAGAVKARWYWCMFTHFIAKKAPRPCGQPETHSSFHTTIKYGCLGVDWCNVCANWLSQNSLKLKCHSSTSQNG